MHACAAFATHAYVIRSHARAAGRNVQRPCRLMRKRMLLAKASMWLMKGWNSIDLASQMLLVVVIAMRLAGKHITQATFYVSSAACCAVLLWSKMLFFMMPFATTGAHLSFATRCVHAFGDHRCARRERACSSSRCLLRPQVRTPRPRKLA
jgi:hypothetical protein